MKYVLITGVSSGIGYATAKRFLNEGFFVFGSVRKLEDKKRLENEFGEKFLALQFDITDETAVESAFNIIKEKIGNLGLSLLVNNAGMAEFGPMEHINLNDFRNQLEVNLIAPIMVTQKFLPLLGTDSKISKNKGRIIMISSTSGKFTRPLLGPYSASKHGLEAISDAWRRELKFIHKIPLIIVEPGPIKTDIWNKAKKTENKFGNTRYSKIMDGLNNAVEDIEKIAIEPEKVANIIWKATNAKKPKARYLIAPKQFLFWLLLYVLPDWFVDRMLLKDLKKTEEKHT